jgi:hypothetical protein
MVLLNSETELPQYRQQRGAWLNKNNTVTLEEQLLAYRQDLRIGRDYCVICRQSPTPAPVSVRAEVSDSDFEDDEGEELFQPQRTQAVYGFI